MMADPDQGVWNVDTEVSLFYAMRGHKPVGVNKHFQMMFIHDKMSNAGNRKLTTKQIWHHLGWMYDLQALNESEVLAFPNKETDFVLPENDYSELMSKEFPRFTGIPTTDESKNEGKSDTTKESQAKSTIKSEKSDKPEGKQIENKLTSSIINAATPENSPKRKRTRQGPSTSASPATPDAPPSKRRR